MTEVKSWYKTIEPWIYIGVIVLAFTLLKFWYAMLALFVFYFGLALWQLWKQPYILYMFESYAVKWEGGKNDKWYARAVRFVSRPIYWLVDKAKERHERETGID